MIRHYVEQGEPKAKVAERFGVCRQTVYNHLQRQEPEARSKRVSKLDPYKSYIKGRLEDYDLPATAILTELRERGYSGSTTILRTYMRSLKGEKSRRVTERFETEPGAQAQLDWGECGTVLEDGRMKKLYVFVFVLGFSRMLFARFTTSTKTHVLLSCLKEAFATLGISRELLVDNMKQAVERHTADGVQWNKTFLDFCEHYGCVPRACPPYWPRAKGKVERGVGYLKTSFLEGRSFTDLADLNRQTDTWLDAVANVRVHGTTGERPADRYQQELSHLRPASRVAPLDVRPAVMRTVGADSMVRYAGVTYSVDPVAVGKSVTVREESERPGSLLQFSLGTLTVGVHRRASAGTRSVMSEEHRKAIRTASRGRRTPMKGRRVAFDQQLPESLEVPAGPEVERRELALYEELLATPGRN